MMIRNRGWTLVAVLSLAVGLGINTAFFSVVNSILVDKLPVRDPDELVALGFTGENDLNICCNNRYGLVGQFSSKTFEQLRSQNQLSDLFAFGPSSPSWQLNIFVDGQTELPTSQFVSGSYFRALGVPAVLGRTIEPGDDVSGAEPVVVISHDYWTRQFDRNPGIIGSTIFINVTPFTIVGVTPETLRDITGFRRPFFDISPLRT
jgi:hypothetical protein